MTQFVTSADGTRIAYDRIGEEPPLIVIGGIFCDRAKMEPLAGALAKGFGVINYDRRGRGESGDTAPYAVEREIEDLHALIDAAGGNAMVYGHSSGAGLALNAAAAGLPITRLVLHEPPYGADDEDSKAGARDLAKKVRDAIAADRRTEAVSLFFAAMEMPDDMVAGIASDPKMQAVAPTMPYDFAVMGDFTGGTIPEDKVRAIAIPTLVLAGGASPDFFRDAAERIDALLPNGTLKVIDGQDHDAPADAVAPVVLDWLRG